LGVFHYGRWRNGSGFFPAQMSNICLKLNFLICEYRGGVIKRHIAILLICRCRDRIVVGLQLPVQSVPITTIDVSSNRARRCARNSVERGVKHHGTNPELI
jgi:hypothetical protein